MHPDARDKLTEGLKEHEGLRLKVYDDASGLTLVPGTYECIRPGRFAGKLLGNATIGYGRNLYGRGISKLEAELFLKADITDAALSLDELAPWWGQLDPVRQVVLADMAFNMGPGRFVSGWPNFLDHVRFGRYGMAAAVMRGSKWATQVGARAEKLSRMMESGKWA